MSQKAIRRSLVKLHRGWQLLCGIVMASLFFLCMTGCEKSVELENREYVLSLGIDLHEDEGDVQKDGLDLTYEEARFFKEGSQSSEQGGQTGGQFFVSGFYELFDVFGHQSDKYLDLNHLKTIVIGKSLAEDQNKLVELLQYIEKNQLFANNVKIFVAEDKASDILALGERTTETVGEYLENLFLNSNYYVDEQSTDVGKLLSHWHNFDELLYVPIVGQQNQKPSITGYALMNGMQLNAILTEEEADLVFLGNGILINKIWNMDNQHAVEVKSVKRKNNYLRQNGVIAEIDLTIRASVCNQRVEKESIKNELEAKLEAQIENSYSTFLEKWEIDHFDFFHTFAKLAAKDQNLWIAYKNKKQNYMQQLHLKVFAQVELVDE